MKIKLLKPHRHAGKNYQAGDIIDLDLDTANYLAELKVATPVMITSSVSQEQSDPHKGRGKPAEISTGVMPKV